MGWSTMPVSPNLPIPADSTCLRRLIFTLLDVNVIGAFQMIRAVVPGDARAGEGRHR